MDIHAEIELDICPICGGAGLLDEENGFCWAVYCMDCGAHTASIEYRTPSERFEVAKKAAHLWNVGKLLRSDPGE